MNNTHLQIKGLWHHYGHQLKNGWSLESINLNLKKGELVGLLGPSGCGKTTLLRLIAGFEKPCKGEIALNNQIIATPNYSLPPERRGIGMVFQDYALFPHLDAWRNVCFGLKNGMDKSRARWLLELLGLTELRSRYPHELSGGQRQRLALARALAPGSSLVVLDEPFSNLDVEVRLLLRSELSSVLNSCSASGLLVTHDPQEALAICDRVAVMKQGQLHQCSSPSDLVDDPATPFVGRFVLQRNVLPVINDQDYLITPVGKIPRPNSFEISDSMLLMLDEYSLEITPDEFGNGTIQGREFLGSHWLIRVKLNSHIVRVWHPILNPPSPGEKCCIGFRQGKTGILFPGSFKFEF